MASSRVRTRGRLHPSHGQIEGQFFVMKKLRIFSIARFRAMLAKEFIQMRRDRLTLAMMIGIPLLQLILFGYAINSDPKHLPTAIVSADHSPFTRSFIADMQNSGYFNVLKGDKSPEEADWLLRTGQVQFIVY